MATDHRLFYGSVNRKLYEDNDRGFYTVPAMKTFGARVRYAREKRGISQTDLAAKISLKQPSLLAIEKGDAKSSKHLLKLAKVLKVEPAWLEGDDTQEPDWSRPPASPGNAQTSPGLIEVADATYTPIPRFDAGLSAGNGSLVEANPTPLGFHLIETSWLRSLTRAQIDSLAVVRVDGDSMERTLFDGDWVLVDMSQKRLSREGIYAIQVFENAWIKRISLNLRDKLVRIISDNSVVPMQEYPEDELMVLGRVIALVARRIA